MKNKIAKQLRESFSQFVGQKNNTEAIKQQVSLATQKCMQSLEANINGYEVISCDILWNQFSFKQKTKWFVVNKLIPSIGDKARAQYEAARRVWYGEMTEEDFENGNYYPVKLDPLFESNPKGIIVSDVSISTAQPSNFTGIKATIGDRDE